MGSDCAVIGFEWLPGAGEAALQAGDPGQTAAGNEAEGKANDEDKDAEDGEAEEEEAAEGKGGIDGRHMRQVRNCKHLPKQTTSVILMTPDRHYAAISTQLYIYI